MLTGWITGVGVLGPQAVDAVEFYQDVVGKSIFNGTASNVILTGHSLGGGLAGLIASITGDRAEVFDAMPYEGAATLLSIFQNIALGITDPTTLFGTNPQAPLFSFPTSSQITSVSVAGEPLEFVRAVEAAVAGTYAALLFPGPMGIALGTYVAANATSLLASQNNVPPFSIPGTGLLDTFNLHSQALLVLAQWAQDNNQTAWQGASQQLMQALFGNDGTQIADALGISGTTGNASGSAQLIQMIAYSALYNPDAANWQLVFGDAAIRALFDDTGDLGAVLTSGDVCKTLSASAQQIMDMALQFAGRAWPNSTSTLGLTIAVWKPRVSRWSRKAKSERPPSGLRVAASRAEEPRKRSRSTVRQCIARSREATVRGSSPTPPLVWTPSRFSNRRSRGAKIASRPAA
jgi:serralysin